MIGFREQVEETIAAHFDRRWGSPYWLEQESGLPFNPRKDIHEVEDLLQFPPFPLDVLARCPVEHMIPKRFHDTLGNFITAETGGATGPPKRTAYHADDFHEAFVAPFVAAATLMQFPRNRNWLFVGPSGPHIIGKAARGCAQALESMDPFSVDVDPRWVRKLLADSLGRTRYLDHVLEQAMHLLDTQHIGVLFSTPPVLEALAKKLSDAQRHQIGGIHLGGMAASPEFWAHLTTTWFPNAVALSGYGNSLAGVCPQITPCVDGAPVYVPFGKRIAFCMAQRDPGTPTTVCFHRLDRACFLPNVVEGDEAYPVSVVSTEAGELGFHDRGLKNPRPLQQHRDTRQGGLY